ncbi:MAG: hypothetical protein KGH58_04255, partial [Candidatus Micrarchaeota archaeon]|nr:hypothetical protein [Candidatus Micrarchaeota archaeon]
MLVERAPGHEAVSENAAVKRLASALNVSERVEQEAQRMTRIAAGYLASSRIEGLETGAMFLALESVYIREKSYGNLRSIEEIALANFGKDYNFALHDRIVRNAAEYLINERIAEPTMVPRENYVKRWIGIIVGKLRLEDDARSSVVKRTMELMGNNPAVESWMGSAHLTAAAIVKAATPGIGMDQLARAVGPITSEEIIRQKVLEFAGSMALQMPHDIYAERLAQKHSVAIKPSARAGQGISLSDAVHAEEARTKRHMLRSETIDPARLKSDPKLGSQTDLWIKSIAKDLDADERTQEIALGLLVFDNKMHTKFTGLHENWRAYLAGAIVHI